MFLLFEYPHEVKLISRNLKDGKIKSRHLSRFVSLCQTLVWLSFATRLA
jgi:hypothetical protein